LPRELKHERTARPSIGVGVAVSKKKFDGLVERPDGRGKSNVFSNDAAGFGKR
jgi:transposase